MPRRDALRLLFGLIPASGPKPLVLRGHEGGVMSAAFDPDGKRIVTASKDKTVRVWKADGNGEPIVLRGYVLRPPR
jgi:WD40 repeat protein